MLTKNEKLLIADSLNGCHIWIDSGDTQWMQNMTGHEGAIQDAAIIGRDDDGRVLLTGSRICSGLELEVYDSCRLNGTDAKWHVDGAALLEKIRALTAQQREQLIRAVADVWRRDDENFEQDLDAIQI